MRAQPVKEQSTPKRALPSPPETPASPTIEQYICRNLPAALGTNAFTAFTGSRLLQDSAVIVRQSGNPASCPARDSATKTTNELRPESTSQAIKSVLGIDLSKGATKVSALLRAIADLVDGAARDWTADAQPGSERPSA